MSNMEKSIKNLVQLHNNWSSEIEHLYELQHYGDDLLLAIETMKEKIELEKEMRGKNDTVNIKSMIRFSSSTEEADKYIEKITGLTNIKDKIKFIGEMFEAVIVDRYNETEDEELELKMDYEALLSTIIF